MPRLHASVTPWYAEAMRRWRSAPPLQPALDDGRRLFGVGGQSRGKLRFNPVGFVQLDQPLAAHGLDRVAAVGDDHHVGGEGGRAENGQGCRQRNGQAEGSPARREPGKRCWHVACP
jgi:hypothetical protein